MIASERSTQHTIYGSEHGTDKQSAYGKSVSHTFGHCNNIGTNTGILMGEELSATTVARLYLIDNKHRTRFGTNVPQSAQELVIGQLYTTYPLYALDHDSTHIAGRQLATHSIYIVQCEIHNIERMIYRCYDFGVIGYVYSSRRTAMKRVRKRNDFFLPCMERCQFQRIFIGLGTGIDQEETVIVISRRTAELIGQFDLQGIDYRIGIKRKLIELFRQLFHIIRMGMTYRNYGMTAVKVEILVSFIVIHMTTFSPDDIDIEKRIYIK